MGMAVGAFLVSCEIGPGRDGIPARRRALQLLAAWCIATVVIRPNALQVMAWGAGMEIGDDVLWIVMFISALRQLWWLRSDEKEDSDDQRDA